MWYDDDQVASLIPGAVMASWMCAASFFLLLAFVG